MQKFIIEHRVQLLQYMTQIPQKLKIEYEARYKKH